VVEPSGEAVVDLLVVLSESSVELSGLPGRARGEPPRRAEVEPPVELPVEVCGLVSAA
jgi:hypothetical protein